MSGRATLASGRRRRKTITVVWIALLAVATISLIYWEMSALLYILATVGVTVLLIIVAFSDLAGADKVLTVPAADDAAVLGSGMSSTYRNGQTSPEIRKRS
jgi:hypothetical protein